MLHWIGLPVLLLLHQVFHVSLVTLDLVIHVIPSLSTRLNLSKVA